MAKKEIKKTTNKATAKQKAKTEKVVNEVVEPVVEETVNEENVEEPVDGISGDEMDELFAPVESDHEDVIEDVIDIVDMDEDDIEDIESDVDYLPGTEGSELEDFDEKPNTDLSAVLVPDEPEMPEGVRFEDVDIDNLKNDIPETKGIMPQNLSSLHGTSEPKMEREVYQPVNLSSLR